MAKHVLTDRAVRNARPREKPYRLFDGQGLALWVSPTGVKSWQLRYRLNGKEQTATLGKLDRLTLADARDEAEKQRKLVANGEHLTTVKRAQKLQQRLERVNTFESVASDWVLREARRKQWTLGYVAEVESSIRNHLASLNSLPVAKLTAHTIASVLRAVEHRAPLMLEKVRRRVDAILDYAVEYGVITGNPLAGVPPLATVERRHYPAVTDLKGIGEILRAARASDPCKGIQRAHLLLAFTALRASEVVSAKWDEFDLDGVDVRVGTGRHVRFVGDAGNWNVPRERVKRKDDESVSHVVPLPPVLLHMLREWRKADGKGAVYVCPAPRHPERSITAEAVEKHYRNVLGLSGKHSPHSWRSAFSTICELAGKDKDIVEAQLDHVVGTTFDTAHDRAQRLEQRRALLAWYEATLIGARDGRRVTPIKRPRTRPGGRRKGTAA